jgi:hypothetical protein
MAEWLIGKLVIVCVGSVVDVWMGVLDKVGELDALVLCSGVVCQCGLGVGMVFNRVS